MCGSVLWASCCETNMLSPITQLLRSRWFSLTVHAAFWLMLVLALASLGGKAPEHGEGAATSAAPIIPVPVTKLGSSLASSQWPRCLPDTNSVNAFFTMHFVPPPTPAPAPAPTTKKIDVVYQGYYETADSGKVAMLKVADAFVTARVGACVATNHFIAQATMQTLTITNIAAQTNVLPVNVARQIEIPIK
jgi:hypothetical protein